MKKLMILALATLISVSFIRADEAIDPTGLSNEVEDVDVFFGEDNADNPSFARDVIPGLDENYEV